MYHVPHKLIPLLFDPPFVVWMCLLAISIGYRILSPLKTPQNLMGKLEKCVLSAAVGFGILQFLPYSLGMVGLLFGKRVLTPELLWAGMIILSLINLKVMKLICTAGIQYLSQLRISSAYLPTMFATGILFIVLLVNALSISAYTADDGYHLTGPKRWLESGGLQYLPTMTNTNAPMGVEMLYTIPLGIWSETSARLLALAIGIFALSSVIALGRIRQSVWLGLAAVTLLVFGFLKFNLFQLLTDAYVDFAVTLEVTCAAIAILYFLRSSDRRWAVVAALFAGFAASFKPTALFLGISIAIVLLMELVRMRSSNIPKLIVSLLIICLLPLLPWMFRTWYLTGNPIYPMLANVFPTRDWSAEQGVAFTNFFKYYNWGTFMGSGMSLHHRVVILNVLRGVIALSAIAALRKITNIENRVLYVLICLFGISLMSNTGLYIRYYLPIQGIAYVLALSLLMRNRFSVKIAQITIPILILVIVWVGMKSDRGNYMEKTKFITGINSREKQLSSDTSGFYQTWKYVNEKVEPDAPILVTAFFQSMAMNAGGTFLSDHPCYTTDAYLQTCIRMDTWENYIKDIQRLKLEYVFSSSILRYENHSASYAPAANEYPFSRRLVKEYGNLLFRAGEFEVYKLDGLNDSLYFKQR